jgi:hypothetical protein
MEIGKTVEISHGCWNKLYRDEIKFSQNAATSVTEL